MTIQQLQQFSDVVYALITFTATVLVSASVFFTVLANTLPAGSKWQRVAVAWGSMIVTGINILKGIEPNAGEHTGSPGTTVPTPPPEVKDIPKDSK